MGRGTRTRQGPDMASLPAVYRTLEASASYVLVRGFEPLEQEQMMLAYVEAQHRITRAEATELCAITPAQASRLLRRLAAHGKLVWCGERRGSFYEKPTLGDR